MAFVLTKKKKAFAVGFFALILIIVVVYGFWSRERTRHPDKFLIPSGYVGWIVIEHGVKGAPPTKIEGNYLVYRFPASGHMKTSTPIEYGIAEDKAYYVTSNRLIRIPDSWLAKYTASDVLIWDWGTGGAIPEDGIPLIEYAFIGTQSQYAKASTGPDPKSEKQQTRDDALAAQDRAEQSRQGSEIKVNMPQPETGEAFGTTLDALGSSSANLYSDRSYAVASSVMLGCLRYRRIASRMRLALAA